MQKIHNFRSLLKFLKVYIPRYFEWKLCNLFCIGNYYINCKGMKNNAVSFHVSYILFWGHFRLGKDMWILICFSLMICFAKVVKILVMWFFCSKLFLTKHIIDSSRRWKRRWGGRRRRAYGWSQLGLHRRLWGGIGRRFGCEWLSHRLNL